MWYIYRILIVVQSANYKIKVPMGTKGQNITDAWAHLTTAKSRWNLADDGEIFKSHSSLLQPVLYDGKQAMVKIPFSAEERRGCLLMVWYNGNGAAQVWEHDETAILMERATGPLSLREMVLNGNEDEASRIICGVTAKLHTVSCAHSDMLVPLTEWFKPLKLAADIHGGILIKCTQVAEGLLSDPIDEVILHGDIHHENILHSAAGRWIAIDPKGLVGERVFDIANVFCNPDSETATSPARLSRQVEVIAEAANLDPVRLLHWIIAWAGLSAAFALEDGENPTTALAVAKIAENELGR